MTVLQIINYEQWEFYYFRNKKQIITSSKKLVAQHQPKKTRDIQVSIVKLDQMETENYPDDKYIEKTQAKTRKLATLWKDYKKKKCSKNFKIT